MPTRATSLQDNTLTALTREIGSKYDNVELLVNNIDTIEAIAEAIEAGFDFHQLTNIQELITDIKHLLDAKVDKAAGYGLSDEDFTQALKDKLDSIAAEATKNLADTILLNRTNHTGLQSLDTTTDSPTRLAMSSNERVKLEGIETDANNYIHPVHHHVNILDGSDNQNKFVKSNNTGITVFDDILWSDINGKPTSFTPSAHEHDMAQVTSGSLAASRIETSSAREFVTHTERNLIHSAEQTDQKGQPNGYVPLNSIGKVDAYYLSALNMVDVFPVQHTTDLLTLNHAAQGDMAWVEDTGATFILVALPPSDVDNWKPLTLGGVSSVNGLTDVVTLGTDQINEGTHNKYYTNKRVDDRVAALLQAGTNISLVYDDVNGTLTLNVDDLSVDWSQLLHTPTTVEGYGITNALTTSHAVNSIVGFSPDTAPLVEGATGLIGESFTVARGDHTHTLPAYPTTLPASDVYAWAKTESKPVYSKAEIGLSDVDNTADIDKPVSTAVQAKFDALNSFRSDKFLATQDINTITYDENNNIVRIDYGNTDLPTYLAGFYEKLIYASGRLSKIEHYLDDALAGTTTFDYNSDGTLHHPSFQGF